MHTCRLYLRGIDKDFLIVAGMVSSGVVLT
jgi:hypothetical protein